MRTDFDVIVIGGGHAGIEASHAAAKMGCATALITTDRRTIGRLSCNPSIGGSAKGHLVKEIDALGGIIGLLGDRSGIQFKMLNTSKGRAVWSPRSQNDKDLYPYYAQRYLHSQQNLTILDATVEAVLIQHDKIQGVICSGSEFRAQTVILCSGTFLNGTMYTGLSKTSGGRVGEHATIGLTERLNEIGVSSGKLKTGTPPRILARSIDYSKTELAVGDSSPTPFSYRTGRVKNLLVCYSTATTDETHGILASGFAKSPMFTGLIQGSGPRYCPSIEDKIARFTEKSSHQILLEPEGLSTDSVYVNGFSTSLPRDTQEAGLRSIPGLENTTVLRYGYAVEYDFFHPYQLHYTLESRYINGLYFAGQVNGTSGYEEAAAQGLIAGINAALSVQHRPPFTLKRSEAYIGVMIDDLVNKSSNEPYRIFTSLAEYRLLLRQDNASIRLMKHGYELGLIDDGVYRKLQSTVSLRNEILEYSGKTSIHPEQINDFFLQLGESVLTQSELLKQILRRPVVSLHDVLSSIQSQFAVFKMNSAVEQAEVDVKYEGYIQRQQRDIARFIELENTTIPQTLDYHAISSLSKESQEKLSTIKPRSLGQASRIMGVSSSDISILALYLR